MQAQIELLRSEIQGMEGTEDPEQQALLAQKQEQLTSLEAELAQKQAAYEAGLLAAGTTEEGLNEAIVTATANAAEAKQVLDALVASIEKYYEQ